jgi:hypothetical protein
MANLNGQECALLSLPGARPTIPFGGVVNDARWMFGGLDGPASVPGVVLSILFWSADIPFSLVGDIVTLPQVLDGVPDNSWRKRHLMEPPAAVAEPIGMPACEN